MSYPRDKASSFLPSQVPLLQAEPVPTGRGEARPLSLLCPPPYDLHPSSLNLVTAASHLPSSKQRGAMGRDYPPGCHYGKIALPDRVKADVFSLGTLLWVLGGTSPLLCLSFAVPFTWVKAPFSGGLFLLFRPLGIWKSNFNFSACLSRLQPAVWDVSPALRHAPTSCARER